MRADLVPLAALLFVAAALLATGILPRVGSRLPALPPALCLAGVAAALLSLPLGPALLHLGPTFAPAFALDALSATFIAALLLVAACDRPRPALTAALTLALLAADPLSLGAASVMAVLAAPRGPGRSTPRAMAALGTLAVALLALAWSTLPDAGFAAIRAALLAAPLGPVHGTVLLAATLAAAALLAASLPRLPGAVLATGLLARLLIDLPGPITPAWWGVPLLAAALLAALLMARHAAAAMDLRDTIATAAAALLALAAAALGAALLARAADLRAAAALAAAASLLLTLAAALSAALLLRAAAAIEGETGTSRLDRLGGLLPRAPLTGTAMLVGLASMSALPLTLGFAAWWLLLQALLPLAAPGTGRLAGTAVLGLLAAALAIAGLVQALLAAAAFRLAGTVLLGPPRTTQAATAAEPGRPQRVALAALAGVGLVAGLCPFLPMALIQPAVRELAGARAEAASVWVIGPATDAPGYAAPALALLLALALAAACRLPNAVRPAAPVLHVEPWRGGLATDPPAPAGTSSPPPLLLWPHWRAQLRGWPAALTARTLLGALALTLAAALGWAAR